MRFRPSNPVLRSATRRTAATLQIFAALVALAALGRAAPASAALIATGTGTENTSAPNPDPGFARVGVVNGLSGVYFRNGWVLTANHVGTGTFWLGGTGYLPIPGSTVRMSNPDGTLADLIAFKLATRPPLGDIALTDGPPSRNTLITVIGNGLNRGTATTWMGISGWNWLGSRSMRWGTNRISAIDELVLATRAFSITFDDLANPPNGQHEADVVTGDSGGGAFVGSGESAELVGILFARASFVGQPPNTSLFGNRGFIADLFAYRTDLLALVDRPDCADGLDDDGDGLVDYPADPGCESPTDPSERSSLLVCDNGLDDDGDGLIDFPADPGCAFGIDPSEKTDAYQCDNGLDDDGDLAIDFPADSGCLHPSNPIEAPEPDLGAALTISASGLTLAARRRPLRGSPGRERAQTSSTRSTR